jgi:cbb3-type cytochrome oxidase subunit 1
MTSSESQTRTADTVVGEETNSERQDKGGEISAIGGWLVLPIANLFIVVALGPIFLIVFLSRGTTPRLELALLAIIVAYSVLCLHKIFQRKAAAVYMMMGFYGVALLATIAIVALLPARSVAASPAGYAGPIVRGALEIAGFLYFAFSKRVKQTLTK